MAIKVTCGCGHSFVAPDEFGGKHVKCPKCKQPVAIPAPAAAKSKSTGRTASAPVQATRASGSSIRSTTQRRVTQAPPKVQPKALVTKASPLNIFDGFNPLLDLLDDAGVKGVSASPICPNCGSDMAPTAIICVNCGFNRETGKRLETFSDVKLEEIRTTHTEGNAQLLLEKAEREIQGETINPVNEDFGEGADSVVVAIGALLGFLVLVVIGVSTVLLMDRIGEAVTPAKISFYTSIGITLLCALYITWVAFRVHVGQGLACLLTGFLYCIVFGFLQGRSMLFYTILMLASIIIGIATGVYYFNSLTPTY